jgi:hypothetical protein
MLHASHLVAIATGVLISATTVDAQQRTVSLGFPDFGFMPLPGTYDGRVFVLSQDYPAELPPLDAEAEALLQMPFEGDAWEPYMMAVKDYIMAGNTGGPSYEDDFFLEDNTLRDWYHVPWQHWGSTGREGFHGLTQEGPVPPGMLAPEQVHATHAYAVGFYNAQGGFAIGRTWPEPGGPPDLSWIEDSGGFPDGTVVGKLLFVPLDETDVPWLVDPVEWTAYVYSADLPPAGAPRYRNPASTDRQDAPVRLIQMDIMVRDSRVDETGGWIFGTFAYNGALGNANRWDNLVPVGLMWGNDPGVKISLNNPHPGPETGTRTNPALRETIINASEDLPPMHLGWGFRLNGPVDNPNSSCLSCHSTAQYPSASAIMPFLNDPPVSVPPVDTEAGTDWMRWFRNIPWGEAFDGNSTAVTMDFSLQLTKSIHNYVDYLNETVRGQYAGEYWSNGHRVSRNVVSQ